MINLWSAISRHTKDLYNVKAICTKPSHTTPPRIAGFPHVGQLLAINASHPSFERRMVRMLLDLDKNHNIINLVIGHNIYLKAPIPRTWAGVAVNNKVALSPEGFDRDILPPLSVDNAYVHIRRLRHCAYS